MKLFYTTSKIMQQCYLVTNDLNNIYSEKVCIHILSLQINLH